MSKRRRQRGGETDDLFGDLNDNSASQPLGDISLSEIADAGYGSQVALVGKSDRIRVRKIDIFDIRPDVTQPRRAIPSTLRHYWNGDPQNIEFLIEQWLKEVEIERGKPFNLESYLDGNATERAPAYFDEENQISSFRAKPLESAMLKISELAASIHRDGLLNPISVAESHGSYIIETGERRWLAYHLLHWQYGEMGNNDFRQISARIVDKVNIWRQASENNARADLNAIGQARQFALLLMDLLEDFGEKDFAKFDAFDNEQAFYAQVEDGNVHRIPRGKGEELLNAMGLKNTNQLRHIRRLLRLPDPVWRMADDLDWSEHFIQKELLNKYGTDSKRLIYMAVQHAESQGYSVSTLTLDDDFSSIVRDPKTEKILEQQGSKLIDSQVKASLKRLSALGTQVVHTDEFRKNQLLDDVDIVINWLDQIKRRLG